MIKQNFILSICLVLSCLIGCVSKNNEAITGIKITENFPTIGTKGKLLGYDTFSTRIYYHKNQVLYHSAYHFDSADGGRLLTSGMRDYFFVYNKDNSFGLFFDSAKNIIGKKLLVDSVIKKEWINNIDIYQGYNTSTLKPLPNNETPKPGTVFKTYAFHSTRDTGLSGVFNYWFSNKLDHVTYSFSKELDSIHKMKLYKIIIKNNALYFRDYGFSLDPVEQYFEIEEIAILNKPELMKYFEKEEKYFKKE
jgi:hypothetical protein